ncbi:hypothetical protein CWI38_0984p0020 [Hamiltosporidium tvaerminnensis]|uniref:C2H2-type domain-containing protein n=1 Tax=Hamiltosporidium tvaerminnensis TaxID=1176355 RepID=A0A4V2JXI1_9MICR|nr:hypothetical protein CWI38_0984p0020 [Hamiltosporidium tvaerminnensis]
MGTGKTTEQSSEVEDSNCIEDTINEESDRESGEITIKEYENAEENIEPPYSPINDSASIVDEFQSKKFTEDFLPQTTILKNTPKNLAYSISDTSDYEFKKYRNQEMPSYSTGRRDIAYDRSRISKLDNLVNHADFELERKIKITRKYERRDRHEQFYSELPYERKEVETRRYSTRRIMSHQQPPPNPGENYRPKKTLLDYLFDQANYEMEQIKESKRRRKETASRYLQNTPEPIRPRRPELPLPRPSYPKQPSPRKYKKRLSLDEPEAETSSNETINSFADIDDNKFKVLIHGDKKDYICPELDCQKSFPSLSRAKRHFIVHTGAKPFKCLNPQCSKSFSRKDNMLQHYRSHCSLTKDQYKYR